MDVQIERVLRSLRVLLQFYFSDPLLPLQLLLFAALVVVAGLLARRLQRAQWKMPGWRWQEPLKLLYFPVLALVGGRLISAVAETQDVRLPVFERLYALFWILFWYRVALLIGHALLPRNIEVLRRRILIPLAVLAVALRLLGQLGLFVAVLNAPFVTFGTFSISLALILVGPVALITVYAAAQGLRTILTEDVLPQVGLSTSRSYAIGTLTGYVIVVGGVLLTLRAFGIPPSTLTFLSGALAVGVGLGLQSTVNNFVSGFLLMFDPNISVGDRVEVAGERGIVREIGVRNTVIEALDGTRVVMPNATLSSSPVLNLTKSSRTSRVVLAVAVPGAEPLQVREAIEAALAGEAGIRPTPEPMVAVRGFAEGKMNLEVIFWVADGAQREAATQEVAVAIWERLRALGHEEASVTPS
jgi:small-conductance mechanosensitive channel